MEDPQRMLHKSHSSYRILRGCSIKSHSSWTILRESVLEDPQRKLYKVMEDPQRMLIGGSDNPLYIVLEDPQMILYKVMEDPEDVQ